MATTQPQRNWHQFNAEGQTLGRLANEAAKLLMGKHKAGFVKHLDQGDYVVITNVEKVHVTGNKDEKKVYDRYSGFPSGRKEITLGGLRKTHPDRILYRAVKGMLPKNKLQDGMMRRLKLVKGTTNPFSDKFKS